MLALPFDGDDLPHVAFAVDAAAPEDVQERLFERLAALGPGVRASLLAIGPGEPWLERAKGFGPELHFLGEDLGRRSILGRLRRYRDRLRQLAPDALGVALAHDARLVRLAARWAGVPHVGGLDVAPPAHGAGGGTRDAAPQAGAPRGEAHGVVFVVKSDVGRPTAHVAQALHTVGGLAAHGERVAVLAPLATGDFAAVLRGVFGDEAPALARTIRHVPIETLRRRGGTSRAFADRLADLGPARAAGHDVLYFRQVRIASMLLPAARDLGFVAVMEAHQPYTTWALHERRRLWRGREDLVRRFERGQARRDRAYERRVYTELDGLVATTRAMSRRVRRLAPRLPVLRLRNGAPAPVDLAADPAPAPLHDVIYVGKTSRDKGVDVLLAALARLPGRTLLVVGGPTEADLAPFRALAADLGVAGRVSFEGWVAQRDLFARIRRARTAVHPLPGRGSREWRLFTCPLKILEYRALGVPVVASDLPAVREIARDGRDALLVPPDDPAALAAAVARLLEDPALAKRLRDAGLRRARLDAHDRRRRRLARFLDGLRRARQDADPR